MNLTPFVTLTWAYQLHYYLCFRTHRRRPLFSSERYVDLLPKLIQEISSNHDYHLLEQNSYPTQLRCLLSLQPSQTVAKAVQVLKANSSRELRRSFNLQFLSGRSVILRGVVVRYEFRLFENILISSRYIMAMRQEYYRLSIGIVRLSRES